MKSSNREISMRLQDHFMMNESNSLTIASLYFDQAISPCTIHRLVQERE